VEASGASDVNIHVSEMLKVQASGASSVDYKGNARVTEKKTSGASDVKHRN
jgi:hypothetical protein